MGDDSPGTLAAVALVGGGGVVGAVLRHAVSLFLPGLAGTLLANVTGSLALGLLLYEARYTGVLTERARVGLGTGVLSSYTTYSTFAVESVRAGPALLVVNVAATYALGIGGVLVGRELARALGGRWR